MRFIRDLLDISLIATTVTFCYRQHAIIRLSLLLFDGRTLNLFTFIVYCAASLADLVAQHFSFLLLSSKECCCVVVYCL